HQSPHPETRSLRERPGSSPGPWTTRCSTSRASSNPTSICGGSSPARPTSWGPGSRPRWR
uniref:Uncharacterized protein n=1 Tax=Bubo bubo TaxID=30461 RepID=A0A8C0EYP9_BUBBB